MSGYRKWFRHRFVAVVEGKIEIVPSGRRYRSVEIGDRIGKIDDVAFVNGVTIEVRRRSQGRTKRYAPKVVRAKPT